MGQLLFLPNFKRIHLIIRKVWWGPDSPPPGQRSTKNSQAWIGLTLLIVFHYFLINFYCTTLQLLHMYIPYNSCLFLKNNRMQYITRKKIRNTICIYGLETVGGLIQSTITLLTIHLLSMAGEMLNSSTSPKSKYMNSIKPRI